MTDAEKIAFEAVAKTGSATLANIYLACVQAGISLTDAVLAVRSLIKSDLLASHGDAVSVVPASTDPPRDVERSDKDQTAPAEPIRRRVRRPQSRKLGTDRRKGLSERVIELLTHEGPKMLYREVCRRLSTHRYPEWKEAIAWLEQHKAVHLADGWIELTDEGAADRLRLAPPYPEEKPTKPKRKRMPSKWFQERYRRALETGQSVSEVIEQERFRKRNLSNTWPGWENYRT